MTIEAFRDKQPRAVARGRLELKLIMGCRRNQSNSIIVGYYQFSNMQDILLMKAT